jgi:hypothetical protein
MKKSAIKDIFYGFRGNIETMHMPKELFDKSDVLCDAYDELKEKLSPEMFKLYEKFVDALESNSSEGIDFYFVEGFTDRH